MQGRFLLNVVVREGSAVFQLLSSEDQSLLLRWNSFLVLNFGLDVLDGVIGLDVQGDRLSGEGLDEDLHGTTSKSEDKMQGRFLLNVVVREGSAVFQLLSSEDQSLLLRWNSFLVLDFGLDILNRVVGLDVQGDRLSGEGLDENLHSTTAKAKDKMECRLFLDVVIRKRASIFKLLSSEDQPLLLRWDSFLVLDLGLHVLNGVVRLDVQGNRLPCEGLDKDLHGTTTKTKDKVKSRFLLDVVIRKSTSIFQLLTSEDQPLLLWRNSFLVLDLGLDVLNRVIWLDIKCNCLAREGLDENLHSHGVFTKI